MGKDIFRSRVELSSSLGQSLFQVSRTLANLVWRPNENDASVVVEGYIITIKHIKRESQWGMDICLGDLVNFFHADIDTNGYCHIISANWELLDKVKDLVSKIESAVNSIIESKNKKVCYGFSGKLTYAEYWAWRKSWPPPSF